MSKVNCFIIVLLGLILGACGDDKKTGAPLSGVTSQFTAFAPENDEEEMLILDFME